MAQNPKPQPWRRYDPSAQCPWNLARAAHLWRRGGFGASWGQLQKSVKAGPQKTVDILLKPKADVADFNRTCDDYAKAVNSAEALRAWWLRRMIRTPHPLLEKMTLFWHDFFAVSAAAGPSGPQMRVHVAALRKNAMGRFPILLTAVASDAATLLSLGAKANRKAKPDETFPRQLLARYTVGPEAHSDKDVREVARAMTGWFVLRNRRRYFEREHDGGEKTVLGKTGKFKYADVVKIAAEHPATARNIVRKLYRWFISEAGEPEDALLAPLIESFARNFDVAQLVETMLRSNLFFSNDSTARRIKRPVEFAVGIIRALEATTPTIRLAADLAGLGENLYYPPTLNGWAGGQYWINHATVIGLNNLAASLLAASGPYGGKCDPSAVAKRHGQTEAKAAGRFLSNLLGGPNGDAFEKLWKLTPPDRSPPNRLRNFAYSIITKPEFQLA
jgi:uncharacterized protein (DUF1800 family)